MHYAEEAHLNRMAKMALVKEDGQTVMQVSLTRTQDGFVFRFTVPAGCPVPTIRVESGVAGAGVQPPSPAAPAADPRFEQARRNAERVGLLGRLNKLGAKKPEHLVNNFDPADIGWAIEQFKLQGKKVDNVAAYLTSMIRYRKK